MALMIDFTIRVSKSDLSSVEVGSISTPEVDIDACVSARLVQLQSMSMTMVDIDACMSISRLSCLVCVAYLDAQKSCRNLGSISMSPVDIDLFSASLGLFVLTPISSNSCMVSSKLVQTLFLIL